MAAKMKGLGAVIADSLRMKGTELEDSHSKHIWSNEDLDPVSPERRVWTTRTYALYWLSEAWSASIWSVGSSMVAGGLNWWQALIAALVGHFIGAMLTIWNGRGGSVYHIGFPVWIRASFGMWGAMFPVFVRCVLDLVWFSIQTYFGGLFMDVMLQCIFGQSWTAIPNMLPTESSTSTRFMAAYFLYWLVQLCICFFRPHQVKWLFAVKSTTMPCACVGLFIWALVRSGGPPALGSLQTKGTYSSKLIAWTFVASINAAINGEFGPLIASEPDITRYSKHPRNQIIGVGAVAPWCATLVCLLGIITAACTQTIYGEALWNPAAILNYILAENNDSKTKFAVFCCSFVLMIGQTGTNFVANLIPFGVDATSIAPKYLNIVRSHLLCALIGGWALVPWKVLTSGAVFISCITGMGIWMGSLVGIMLADYFFVRNGNYFVEDLYTSNPNGRYWYTHGINWRAYAAYLVAVMIPFPGFLGQLGVSGVSAYLGSASKIYYVGYITSTFSAMAVYTILCKIWPMADVAEARAMRFEEMGKVEVILGVRRLSREGSEEVERSEVEFNSKV